MKALAADDPRVIGEYRLRAQLGAGGMGRVYLGLSPAGRAVAIKVVHPELASDADFLRRFAQEVAAARAVSGIYTAPVVASGLNERPPWLATAFVPGPSLEQVITEHGPPPEQALWPLLGGLVEALQAIHDCGVVHRDLKPANVLLATDGPRVIDFGISRAADGTALTAAGIVFGTPGYMSPEQAEGRPAGPASDVFALGCVIAYAATGAGPFGTGTAAAILYRVVHSEPALDVGPGLPPRLREIVSRCLAKDPAARPTPRALAAMLADGMTDTGPSAVTFWPRPVASLIGAYQARLEEETKAVRRPADEFSWSTASHPRTTPSDPGGCRNPGWPPAPGAGPGGSPPPRWPYGGASAQAGPAPQGPGGSGVYAGAQPSPPPPRGYLPASAGIPAAAGQPLNGGFPLGAGPAYQGPVPGSVLSAVRLMYAGATFALIYAVGFIAVVHAYLKDHPATSDHYNLSGLTFAVVFVSLIEAAVWLAIARACKRGKSWARITGTALFGLYTIGALGVLGNPHSGIAVAKLLTVVSWLIACAAAVFLWQRASSAFFRSSRQALG
jgi:serine/threonine protein kinase